MLRAVKVDCSQCQLNELGSTAPEAGTHHICWRLMDDQDNGNLDAPDRLLPHYRGGAVKVKALRDLSWTTPIAS